jgi:hypothetical protein
MLYMVSKCHAFLLQGEDNYVPLAAQAIRGPSLFSLVNCKWIFLGTALAAANQLTGINAVIFYSQSIFASAGLHNVAVITIGVVTQRLLIA